MTVGSRTSRLIALLVVLGFSCSSLFAGDSPSGAPDPDRMTRKVNEGSYEEAIDRIRSHLSTERAGNRGKLLSVLLRGFRITGRYEEGIRRARDYLQNSSESDGKSRLLSVRADLAQLLFLHGKHQAALEQAERVIEEDPERMKARWIRVRVHRRTGRYEKLGTDFSYAAEYARTHDKITDRRTVLHLARLRWMDGRWNGKTRVVQAVNRRLTEANERFENDPELMTLWADLFRVKRRDGDARSTYRDVMGFNKNYPPALLGMAVVLLRNQQSLRIGDEQARSLMDRAIETNPVYLPALVRKARQQMNEKSYEDALKTVKKAIDANSNAPSARAVKAVYHYRRDETEAYRKARERVLEINENYGLMDGMLARGLSEDFQYKTARKFFAQATERNPHLWSVMRDQGVNELRLGNDTEGRKLIERAFRNNRFDVLSYNMLELLDKLENKFRNYTIPGYRVRVHRREADYAHPYILRLLRRHRREFTERYDFQLDEPTKVDVFEDHRDFSVRTAGIQGLGALGACFGTVSICLSPRARDQMGAFNWGAILWHEMAHAYALQMSNMNVPRWFTEGLSTYEESRGHPAWEREKARRLFRAWRADRLPTIPELSEGKGGGLLTYYLYGSVIIEFLVEQYGFQKIPAILRAYGEGASSGEAFQRVLGSSLDEVQSKFGNYMKNRFGDLPFREPVTRIRTGRAGGGQKEKQGKQSLPVPGEERDPADSYSGLVNQARVLVKRGRYDRAKELVKRAKDMEPERSMAYAVTGDVHFQQLDWVLAVESYEQAYERGARDMRTLLRYGKSLEKVDRSDHAISIYEEARDSFPGYVDEDLNPYLQLFPLYVRNEKPQKAVEVLEAYTDRAHKDFSEHMKLASLYVDLEKWEKARNLLERVVYVNYRDLELHQRLVKAYEALEQWKKAHTERHVIVALLREIDEERKKWDELIADNLYQAARMSLKLGHGQRARSEVKEAREIGLSLEKARDLLQDLE